MLTSRSRSLATGVAFALVLSLPLAAAPATAEPAADQPLFAADAYPVVDGSTVTQFLGDAFQENFTGEAGSQAFHKTHQAYLNLVDGTADLILVTSPSDDELAYAKDKGVTLEVIPVVNEAFVFITNADNPVTSLTVGQLRDIYAGKITNWSQVGGPDAPITAYQRQANSGSQTGMLDLVMQGTPMMDPPTEGHRIGVMSTLVDVVSRFEGQGGALGYSYYYYVTAMYGALALGDVAHGVRLVAVDGVVPTDATIGDQSYPLTTAYYIVYRQSEPDGGVVRQLADAMLSPRGQRVALQMGYVPVGEVDYDPRPVPGPYDGLGVESLDETYTVNPLTVDLSAYSYTDCVAAAADKTDCYRIRGLKDAAVAAKINAEYAPKIDWSAGPLLAERVPVVTANFANVLSIVMQSSGMVSWVEPVANLRLDTGEALALADLFTADADLLGIVTQAAHDYWAAQYSDDGSLVEEATLATRAAFRRNPNPEFYVTADTVTVMLGSPIAIDLHDHAGQVALFKRYAGAGDLYTAAATVTCPVFWMYLEGRCVEYSSSDEHYDLTLEPSSLEALPQGGSYHVVPSEWIWQIVALPDWVTAPQLASPFYGSDQITLDVQPNDTGATRTGVVRIKAPGGDPADLVITQPAEVDFFALLRQIVDLIVALVQRLLAVFP